MSDDDLIAGLQAQVKREVVERYVRERRILEEEINLVLEDASAWHGGLAAWERKRRQLASVLLTPQEGRKFFEAAHLGAYDGPARRKHRFKKPKAWTRCGAYLRLVKRLYRELFQEGQKLAEERQRILELMDEVNGDIRHFEASHDMMGLSAYLRSLDPQELKRRKLLGVNFTAKEMALSAEALSFKPIANGRLEIEHAELDSAEPKEVFSAMEPMLKELCRTLPREVDRLWQ
jgi:hypothetical protein